MMAIVDYGMGNLRSVQKALEKVEAEAKITQSIKDIAQADKIVLPGVGAMQPAMDKLNTLGLIDVLKDSIEANKPFLGICVGFQLLFETSTEGGDVKGLGVLKGKVERFASLKVPHMGWNQLNISNDSCALFHGVDNLADVYFCHSYYAIPEESDVIATTTDYGINFTSSVHQKNLYGVQFHPEKSQRVGLKILENFVKLKL